MGRFDTTKATINANIKKNGNQEITGSILNSVMTEMVDATDAELTELDVYRGLVELGYEEKPYAVYADSLFMAINSSNYNAYVYTVKSGQRYKISTEIVGVNALIAAISFIGGNEYPSKDTHVDKILKTLDVVGVYETEFTPSKDGYIIIANTTANIVKVENASVKYRGGEYVDFNEEISRLGKSVENVSKETSETFEELSIYKEKVDVSAEEKPYAVYADNVYLFISNNYTSLVYAVKKDIKYFVSVNVLRTIPAISAVSFLSGNVYPTTDTKVDTVIKAMDEVGTYNVEYTPSQDGYLIIAKLVSDTDGVANQSVSYRGGEYIDFERQIAELGKGGVAFAKNPYITLPIPELAVVNLVTNHLPTTKKDDIRAVLEYRDGSGNLVVKNVVLNAQGKSSMEFAKKNFAIDIVDENYDDSHEIKFGDWVAQDSFHLKSYMKDGLRVKPLAAYDLYESILLANPITSNRAWKRTLLPADIPYLGNYIEDVDLQINDSAKCHPMGFPIILLHNGEFYGIYCWQLKKHRKNYHQDKNEAGHIHLDSNVSNALLWDARGVIDWEKWAGKKAESETDTNRDGIEIRNPKTLILTDGSKYDGDDNRGELISAASPNYDASNVDMVRTAAVRASIESLSRRVYEATQMPSSSEKKIAIAEIFDVESIIDYIIFGQITGNVDGYKKNWQWVTYDGTKWSVCAYDLDGTWGWSGWSNVYPQATWLHNDTPPITLVIENFADEIKSRYAELRNAGVIELKKIMSPLIKYVQNVGVDYYEQEYEKWTDGGRDNLWRFEVWMEESIRRTDVLMNYTKQ